MESKNTYHPHYSIQCSELYSKLEISAQLTCLGQISVLTWNGTKHTNYEILATFLARTNQCRYLFDSKFREIEWIIENDFFEIYEDANEDLVMTFR